MRVFDRRLVRPTHLHLVESLQEATTAANQGQELLELPPNHWYNLATTIRPEPEGHRSWWAGGGAARMALAWWTDALARRHFRIWADHRAVSDWQARSREPERPPLWYIYPDRLFVRRRAQQEQLLAVCACGACDTPRALGWMGPCCRLCHDRRENQPGGEEPRLTLRAHTGPVRALAFAPDGRTLASAGEVGLTCSPEGEIATSTGDDWRARLWDVASGELLGSIGSAEEQLNALAFSPDGKTLATVSGERTLRLIDLDTRREWVSNQAPAGARALSFAPDGLALALVAEKEVEVWARATPSSPWLPIHNRAGAVGAVALSPQRGVLAVGDQAGRLELVEVTGNLPARPLCSSGPGGCTITRALAFTGDGRWLHSFHSPPLGKRADTFQGHLRATWNVEWPGQQPQQSAWLSFPWTQAWTFSADAHWLAGLRKRSLSLVATFTDRPPTTLEWAPNEPFTCIALSPDGEMLATGGQFGTVKLWPWRRLVEA
jgi:WD40 repeat protein